MIGHPASFRRSTRERGEVWSTLCSDRAVLAQPPPERANMPDHVHEPGLVVANGVVANGLLGPNDENCNMQIKETTGNGTAVAVNPAADLAADTQHEDGEAGEKEYKVYKER